MRDCKHGEGNGRAAPTSYSDQNKWQSDALGTVKNEKSALGLEIGIVNYYC
jgi:hypothetical protein